MSINSFRPVALLIGLALAGMACASSDTQPPAPADNGGAGGHSATGGTAAGGSSAAGGSRSATGGAGGNQATGGSGPATGGGGGSVDVGGPGPSDGGSTTGDDDGAAPASDAAASDGAPPVDNGPTPPGCTLLWNPNPMVDGEKAFEFLEMPDRNTSHPNAIHFSVVPGVNAYRYDSHYNPPNAVDWDRQVFDGPQKDDRLRGEVRGMVGPTGQQDMVNGETWRTQWSLFIPSSLKGTGGFTHIYQLKYIDKGGGVSGSPVLTMSLKPNDMMLLQVWLGGPNLPTISLANLHDKWLWTEVTVKIAAGNAGTVHWTVKDGDKVIVDQEIKGTTWPADAARVRPKWGIYRKINGDIQTTYLMAKDYKAYKCN
jgi:hypothetical protein